MAFEYNRIETDAVESVELISHDSSDYQQFKQQIYQNDNEIPEARQRMAENPRREVFTRLVMILVNSDCTEFAQSIFEIPVAMPDYINNGDELREALKTEGKNTDVQPEITDTTPDTRADCKHSQDDKYRSDTEGAMCCWECSPDDTRKPAKFMADDDPVKQCKRRTLRGYQLKEKLLEHIEIVGNGVLADHFKDSEMDVDRIHSSLLSADKRRSRAISLAFKIAYPDEDYNYQRAEALLRDLDAEVAQESGPGAGGRRFEYEAIEKLKQQFTLREETVFKIKFDEDAMAVYWNDFVEDPSNPTYKEADAIIEGDVGPIVVDFFTQRSTSEKRNQVSNYAELYEAATGDEAKAWGITDTTRAELIELETLVGDATPGEEQNQAGLSDFL